MDNTTYTTLFPIYEKSFLLYTTIFIINILCSIAGIGGGSVLTPIFYLIGNYSLHNSIPLSVLCIMGNSIIRYKILFYKKHINNLFPLIDYALLSIIIPFSALGSFLGRELNKLFSDNVLKYLIIVIFSLLTIKSIKKTYKIYKKEKIKVQNRENVYIDGISITINTNQRVNNINNIYKINKLYFVFSIFIYLCIFSALTIIRIFNPSNIIYIIHVLFSLIIGIIAIIMNNKNRLSPNFILDVNKSFKLSIFAFLIGTLSTMIGIGGGAILSIVLLQMKLKPEIIMATNAPATLANSIISTMQYASDDRIMIQIGGFCFIISAIAGYIGISFYKKFKKKYNKQWIIVFMMSCLMFFSIILVSLK